MAVLLGARTQLITIPITVSQTWTPPLNGTAVIHVIGAGGSGEVDDQHANSAGVAASRGTAGGGAGGYCSKTVTISTGTNWTFVVGAGGLRESGDAVGVTGGNSTATNGAISTMTANGGVGGSVGGDNVGGAGGTASNGDVNRTGGAGGGYGSQQDHRFGGGGAVGIHGTGAAGVIGIGNNGAGNKFNGGTSDVLSPQFENTYGALVGGGPAGQMVSLDTTPVKQNIFPGNGQNGGFLSGGGGAYSKHSAVVIYGGDGGIGGGGGSSYSSNGSIMRGVSGKGGNGLIIVMYLTIG